MPGCTVWPAPGGPAITQAVGGDQARQHIDELARKYLGTGCRNPDRPEGRVILKIAADKVNTPRRMGRRQPRRAEPADVAYPATVSLL